jgi:hypothetical protein
MSNIHHLFGKFYLVPQDRTTGKIPTPGRIIIEVKIIDARTVLRIPDTLYLIKGNPLAVRAGTAPFYLFTKIF